MIRVNSKVVFDEEVIEQKQAVIKTVGEEEAKKRIEQIDKKVIHTNEVVQDGLKACETLNFNNNVKDFAYVALLDHDIGRFAQMRFTGNYNDSVLNKTMGIKDHGSLGAMILEKRVVEQIPTTPIYHEPIKQIVKDHVNKVNDYKDLLILSSDLLKNYSMEELLKCEKEKQVINSITQIVQDVDRLDIYHQILNDRWTPMKTDDDIKQEVFQMFYSGEYLDMQLLREKGLWNANVGELVRLGFINQIKLLSVAKLIKDENIITRLKEKRQNPKALDAFDFANDQLNKMIQNSTDGVTVGKVMSLTQK